MQILIGNDNLLVLDELKNVATDAFINTGATVTATLKTAAGVTVVGPLTLSYVSASDGKYRATVEEDLAVVANMAYEMHIDVDAGSDLKAHWEVPVSAIKRTS